MQNNKGLTFLELTITATLLLVVIYFSTQGFLSTSRSSSTSTAESQELLESKNLFHVISTKWSKRINSHNLNNVVINNCDGSTCYEVSFPYKTSSGSTENFSISTSCRVMDVNPFSGMTNSVSNGTHNCTTSEVPYLEISLSSSKSVNFPIVSADQVLAPYGASIRFSKNSDSLEIIYQSWFHVGKRKHKFIEREISFSNASWAGSGVIINPI